jgi:hypothetical protein
MAYTNTEDIFNDDAIEVIIRFDKQGIQVLNDQKAGSYDDIKQWIIDKPYKCYFSKKNNEEHKLLISIVGEKKNIDLTLKWQPKTFDYKAYINSKSNRVIQEFKEESSDIYNIGEECNLIFIDFNASHFPSREQHGLYERICNLEISPKSNIENQQDIWEKWIEAQQLILNRLSQPIQIAGYDSPIEVNPYRWQFRIRLKQKENPEYDDLSEAIKVEPFNIHDKFFPDGTIFLKYNDIHNGLDRIINKSFIGTFERNNDIGCIIKIKPHLLSDSVSTILQNKYNVTQNTYKRIISIQITSKKDVSQIVDPLFYNGFSFENIKAVFKVEWPTNIKLDSSFLKRKNITFDWGERKNRKVFLPEPIQNTFHIHRQNLKGIKESYDQLIGVFGKKNIRTEMFMEFHPTDRDLSFETEFTDEYWQNLKREIFSLPFEVDANQTENTISFDIIDYDDLTIKLDLILNLENQFNIIKSPLDEDFKFKVKTDLIAKKSKKEEFNDKLKGLAGVEFQINISNEGSKPKHITIGNLASRNSDYYNLVFNLPYKWEDEKKQTNKFLEFIEEEPFIDIVLPNLRGDQAKISWLSEAMEKINNPINGIDSKPVNDKLKDFVFDSSKAEEVFRDLSIDTEDWNELKRHERLILNDSQRRSILSALYSRDLALLQGPPGTGKTTVIAEIIWHMVRTDQSQKILLTSETNLAVDNALERLLDNNHSLVKPIRFGRASKFEEEGKKYSFERIIKWIDEEANVDDLYENEVEESTEQEIDYDDLNNNAVQLWMRRIADNSQQSNQKYSSIMKDWAFEMAQPNNEMKILFKDKYFKYCNVVGSTSSSAGSPRFGADYQRVFNESKTIATKFGDVDIDKFTKKVKQIVNRYGSKFEGWYAGVNVFDKIKSIEFDTVITDEASKATPPELLLPMCFGKKNIIIGDHRQLPPMLHDKSFKELLETLETKEAKELSEEIDKEFVETSQFERLIMHPGVSPTIKSTFNEQYRMHPKINNVIRQFYIDEGGLAPGKPLLEFANDMDLNNPFSRHHGFILKDFINPDIHTMWINVDDPEAKSGFSRINTTEVEAIGLVLRLLSQSTGFAEYMSHWDNFNENKRREEKEIGVISFYGHQVGQLTEVAKYSRSKLNIPIRLNTVDKFQGMERNIIIVSTVRSDKVLDNGTVRPNRDIGFAKSPQRLNVALSRAKRLLIVVGNINFFSQYKNKEGKQIYKNVIDVISNEGIVINYSNLKKMYDNE